MIPLQGASSSLQGGTGIALAPANNNLQPAIPVSPSNVSSPKATTTSTSTPNVTTTSTPSSSSSSSTPNAAQIQSAITFGVQGVNQAAAAGTTEAAANLGATGAGDVTGPSGVTEAENNINLARTQIGTSQINTIKQLMNTIKDGLQGTGVQLGNSGALSSSAADAAARAYANYGNVQTNAANNTAATANQAQDVAQTNLNDVISTDKTQLDDAKTAAVNQIVEQAQSALTSLGTVVSVYLQGNPNLIPTQQIQNQIIQAAQDQLAQVDQNYQNLLNGVNPETQAQIAAASESASNAGVVPSSGSPYSVTPSTSTPATTTGGAPAPSLIPLTLGSAQNSQIPGQ